MNAVSIDISKGKSTGAILRPTRAREKLSADIDFDFIVRRLSKRAKEYGKIDSGLSTTGVGSKVVDNRSSF